MTLTALKASLALWKRRETRRKTLHTKAQADLTKARAKDTHPRQALVDRRDLRSRQLDEARDKIADLEKQIAAKSAPPMRERAFAFAVKDIGVKESGGNNRGADVERIIRGAGGTPGEPWCGDAVAYWYLKAGAKSVTRAWAYVPTLEKLLTKVRNPARGHVAIYNWDGGVADHTGLFDRWSDKSAGTFWAVEGNTGTVNASDPGMGEGVHRKLRNVSELQSFRRVLR